MCICLSKKWMIPKYQILQKSNVSNWYTYTLISKKMLFLSVDITIPNFCKWNEEVQLFDTNFDIKQFYAFLFQELYLLHLKVPVSNDLLILGFISISRRSIHMYLSTSYRLKIEVIKGIYRCISNVTSGFDIKSI